MSVATAALSNVNHRFWNELAHPANFQIFHQHATLLRNEIWARGNSCPAKQVLGKVAWAFTEAAKSLQGAAVPSDEENKIYSDLRTKFNEWEGQNEPQLGAACKALAAFREKCVPQPVSRDPFVEHAEPARIPAAAPEQQPLVPPPFPTLENGAKLCTGLKLEEHAPHINSLPNTSFKLVNCSYLPGGASHTDFNSVINWERMTHLTITGFKSPSLDLSTADNLQVLVIEDSPALRELTLSLPKIQRLVLRNNASIDDSALLSLYRLPAGQLGNVEVVIDNCHKIPKASLESLIDAGLINLDVPNNAPAQPVHKPWPRWLKFLGVAAIALIGLKLLQRLGFFRSPLRG